jgi:Domain of unknown function (DUF222)/HNH endonuclease
VEHRNVSCMHTRVVDREAASTLGLIAHASTDVTRLLENPEMWRLSDREVTAGVEAAYRLASQAQAAALTMLGELDARGLAVEAGAVSTLQWLTASQRIRPEDAKRDLSVAKLLSHAATAGPDAADDGRVEGSALRQGVATGDVNGAQAGIIATALLELPEDATVSTRVLAERLLVDEAAAHGPAALCRLGHRILERIDPDAADRTIADRLAREAREADRLRYGSRFSDGHGSVFYKFRVPTGDDALIWPILDTLAAPEPAGEGIGNPDTRTLSQRFADAFIEAMRRLNLTAELPAKGGDRPRALISTSLETLKSGAGCGTIADTGEQLGAGALRRLCCDAQVISVVLGGESQILDVGRARRTFDGPLHTAVIARDGGCIHSGCARPPRWCDVHHVVPWWNGGTTSLGNGVLLCGFHHRLYDAGTWTITFTSVGIPESTPPPWIDPDQRPRRHERFRERHGP